MVGSHDTLVQLANAFDPISAQGRVSSARVLPVPERAEPPGHLAGPPHSLSDSGAQGRNPGS